MEYGLIGEKLGHSFSKEIHERIGKYKYELVELNKEEFKSFMMQKNFKAINVTMPYKKDVIPYLDYISKEAKNIQAVNTIINKDGKLYGYNTDYYGLKEMIQYFNIEIEDKNALILGTGGTSKTANQVLSDLGCKKIIFVSSSKKEKTLTYEDIDNYAHNVDIIINTTPKEMYPNNDLEILSNLNSFKNLSGVIDVIYNPIRTNLTLKAKQKGVKNCNGLYMLIAQAVYAIEIFLDRKIDKSVIASLYNKMIKEKENIVLIGMPGSGKTTIGRRLASILNKTLVDTDEEIVKIIKMPISEYFEKYGENSFRDIESQVIKNISKQSGLIISTGGGAILRKENVSLLKQNGKLYFLDRDIELLVTSNSRPLSSNRVDLEKRYNERINIYKEVSDVKVDGNCSIEEVVHAIIGGK